MKTNPLEKANPVIICGTDFTPAASDAADVAAALARSLKCPLDLVHARLIRAHPPLDNELSAEAERLRQQGADVRESMLDGDDHADEELVKRANAETCRLVVISSTGKRTPIRWLLGSVSERTAKRARVPTLVVRDSARLLEWTRGERPLHVFVAFNFTETSDAALCWVKELLRVGPCRVVVGYLDDPQEQCARLGVTAAPALAGNPSEVQAILERDLRTRAKELLGDADFHIRVGVIRDSPDATLVEMATEAGADLLVIGSHQYQGFEKVWNTSVSRRVLHNAETNVAVVPLATLRSKPVTIVPPVTKVLVATDFSVLANRAIPHAYSLLHDGGTVHLVHVIHPDQLPDGEYLHGHIDSRFKKRHAKLVKDCQHKLEARIPADSEAAGILSEVEVVENPDPALGIYQAAERFGAHAICLASHGHTGLESALLGSVAMSLLRQSNRPLYLVRVIED